MSKESQFLRIVEYSHRCVVIVLGVMVITVIFLLTFPFFTKKLNAANPKQERQDTPDKKLAAISPIWTEPDSLAIPNTAEGDLIRYGRELVAHTSKRAG